MEENRLLLPSEERRLRLLAEMKADKQANIPETIEVSSASLKVAVNDLYPFLTVSEREGKSAFELEALNRCRKIIWFHERVEDYRNVIRHYPEQKLYKDKFDYEATEPEVKKKQRSTRKDTKKWFD